MAEYTMTLKTVLETLTGKTSSTSYSGMDALVTAAIPKVFGTFQIYDESHRVTLEKLILNHYMFREIGVTPIERFLYELNNKLTEIMPIANPMYKLVEEQGITMFDNTNYSRIVDRDETVDRTATGNDKVTGSTENDSSTNVSNNSTLTTNNTTLGTQINTPQSQLESFLDNKYISSADRSVSDGTDVNDSTSESETHSSGQAQTTTNRTDESKDVTKDDTVENVKGKQGGQTYGQLLKEYADNMMSVDLFVVNALEPVFFGII